MSMSTLVMHTDWQSRILEASEASSMSAALRFPDPEVFKAVGEAESSTTVPSSLQSLTAVLLPREAPLPPPPAVVAEAEAEAGAEMGAETRAAAMSGEKDEKGGDESVESGVERADSGPGAAGLRLVRVERARPATGALVLLTVAAVAAAAEWYPAAATPVVSNPSTSSRACNVGEPS